MNHSEIEACVMKSREGDPKALLKVLEQYKLFIYKTAAQFNIKNYDLQDLMQIAYIAIINAVQKYRPGSNTFSTYAYTAITNAFRYTGRQNARYGSELSLNVPVDNEDDTEFIDCIEALENLEEDLLASENSSEIRNIISQLPYEEAELIVLLYYDKYSLKSYADKKGISYASALRKRNKILKKLSHHITN